MKRFLNGLIETFEIFGLACMTIGSLGATLVGYLILCDRYGVLWPSVVLVVLYILCVLFARTKSRAVKKREVSSVGSNNPVSGSTGSVVKLNDETVATAILNARERERAVRRSPTEFDEPV